jgi:Flp pilus assembly protein TadD
VANAGMSSLTIDDNRESRLKSLLNEQQDSSSLHFALGNRYAEQSRWAEAQQSYFNAYRLEPNNAELAFNLAVSLDRLGQKLSAAQYYQRALQLDPEQHAGFDHKQISQRIEDLTH